MKTLTYVVETVKDSKFIYLGTVTVSLKEVHEAIDKTGDLKDNMPSKFAKRAAKIKWSKANPILVMRKEYWEEKYGDCSK